MTDRPIIFSAPMVRALLEGRKTQTRRLVRLAPYAKYLAGYSSRGALKDYQPGKTGLEFVHNKEGLWHPETNPGGRSAWYVPVRFETGDRLYVRESWCHTGSGVWSIDHARRAMNGKPIYRATDEADAGTKWWPSIHMPREFSRLTLTVSDVRVQRLQAISEEDAKAEGVAKLIWDGEGGWYESDTGSYLCGFAGIWQHLHGADSWDVNPWVVAISFSVAQGNIDRLKS